jgi:hypothetical protein
MASNLKRQLASKWLEATLTAGRCSGQRRIRPAVAAHQSEPFPVLRFTKLDKVFTYGIVATRGSRFAHLGMAADNGGGGRRWRLATMRRLSASSMSMAAGSGPPPAKSRAPAWAQSSVILPGLLIWHGRRHTGMAAS